MAAAPTGITLNPNTVKEGSLSDDLVGILTAADPDPGDTHVFVMVPQEVSDDSDKFWVLGNQLLVNHHLTDDFEAGGKIYTFRLRVTDSADHSFEQNIVVNLADDREEDFDRDGLTETEEEDAHGTSDLTFDSDGDGVGDGAEVTAGTLPNNPGSWSQTSILGWGRSLDGELAVPAGGEYFSLATGQAHSLALGVTGGVTAWGGLDLYGQISVPAGLGEVVAVAAGGDYWPEEAAHSLALKSDGTVVGWGYDHDEALVVPPGLNDVVAIAAGRTHAVALKSGGTVVAWGDNPFGEQDPPVGLSGVVAVSAGGFQTIALKSDGTVVSWGSNFNGEEWKPTESPNGLRDVVAVSCGRFHSLALKSDGTVVAWGYNSHGQTNVPANLGDVVAVSAGGFHSLALKSNGSVVAWGSNSHGQTTVPPSAQSGVSAISAGIFHSLAVHPGEGHPAITSSRIITATPEGLVSHQVQVANAETQTLVFSVLGLPAGLTINSASGLISGSVAGFLRRPIVIRVKTERGFLVQSAWISVTHGNPPTSITLSPAGVMENSKSGTVVGTLAAVDPDAGGSHTFEWVDAAGFADNTWFRIEGDQLILNQTMTRDYEKNAAGFTIQVRALDESLNSYVKTLVLPFFDDRTEDADGDGLTEAQEEDVYLSSDTKKDTDGDGFGDGFEVVRGTTPTNAAGFPSGRMIVGWGRRNDGRIDPPPGLADVIDVSAGGEHSLALKSNGTILAWGGNGDGQASPPEPYQNVIAVAAGAHHSMILKRDGTLGAWGNNIAGQTDIPAGLTGVVAVSAGAYHNLALKNNGSVSAWGYNDYGQCDVPSGLSGVVAVAAGGFHSLALKNDGTVVAWGSSWGGATVIPNLLNGVVAIAAGGYHGLALRHDGTVVAWGSNEKGQAHAPVGLTGVTAISAGWEHSLALKTDGTLVTWGGNAESQTIIPQEALQIRLIDAGDFHNLAIRQTTGFPAFADVSPVRSWPGETLAKSIVLANAVPNPNPSGALFSAMSLSANLALNSTSGLVSGLVTTGERRAVRITADSDQGVFSRVIWFDTAGGVAPSAITLSFNGLVENSRVGTVVGTLAVVDPNLGDRHVLRLASNHGTPDNYWFIISGNKLIVRHRLGVDFDMGKNQVVIRVEAVDSGNNMYARDFALQLTDDTTEDGDGDGIPQNVEEALLGTSDSHSDDFNTADGDHDGVSGLIEHAFNLDPGIPQPPLRLTPGAGSTAGLPAIELIADGDGNYRLRMEYLQRVGDRFKYVPQFGSGLINGEWAAATPVVTPATPGDTVWQRCVVEDSFSSPTAARRFGRVAVMYVPPDRTLDIDEDGVSLALEEDVFGTSDGVPNNFATEDLDHDGVPGMIEYAFNLEPRIPEPPRHIVPFAGSIEGLPAISLVDTGDGKLRLRIEYLRRVDSILTYTPQFSGGLDGSAWQAPVNPVTVTTIEAGKWQRCVVLDNQTITSATRRFARVAVSW